MMGIVVLLKGLLDFVNIFLCMGPDGEEKVEGGLVT